MKKPRLTRLSLPNRGGISSEQINLFCNQALKSLYYLFSQFNCHGEKIRDNLRAALTKEETVIKKQLKETVFFYESLNKIYNRGYFLQQKAKEMLRSIHNAAN